LAVRLNGQWYKSCSCRYGAGPHSDLKIAGGTNVIAGSSTTSYYDDNGHGTHVAGIIVGQGVNGGVKGVAPDSSLYAVKALDSAGSGYTSDIISGIDWAMEHNMDIVSLSLGSNQSSMALQNAVDSAYSKGLLVVAAAGNDGNSSGTGTSIEYPANYSSVIAVGAVDSTNTRAYYTLDGSTPSTTSTSYTGYIKINSTSTLKAIAVDYAGNSSEVLSNLYTIITPPANPVASIRSGIYYKPQTLTLTDTTPGVSIYYATNGSVPTAKSNLYKGPIAINNNVIIAMIAIDPSGNSSQVVYAKYIITKK